MAEANITVSIERTINDCLAAFAQNMLDKHGIRLTNVSFEWLETVGKEATVWKVDVCSTTSMLGRNIE